MSAVITTQLTNPVYEKEPQVCKKIFVRLYSFQQMFKRSTDFPKTQHVI
jgi:hypothetical protein